MSGLFEKNLKQLDFAIADNGPGSLLPITRRNDTALGPTEIFALEVAKEFKADAVYFRRFPGPSPDGDSRPPLPQIYIYDNTANRFSGDEDLAHIHRDLWSNCRIPMFIVIDETDIAIYDTRKPVTVLGDGKLETKPFDTIPTTPINKIKIAADAVEKYRKYSRELFDSGIFWETKAKGRFLESQSAYKNLIDELKKVRDKFKASLPSDDQIALKAFNKLLVFSILVKYLEERGVFPEELFKKIDSKNYCDALSKGRAFELFDKLSSHFNGKIFEWTQEEKEIVNTRVNLKDVAEFLDADIEIDSRRQFFWRRYSFNHLPVELISTVYETLLTEEKDAVFTPEFLVNTLLDEAMPLSDYKKTAFKTIDVSCGSGIFLVGVFKRLAQRHRYLRFKETGELTSLNPTQLLKIIKDNIFGVDIEEDSRRLTVFSLCLALCDELNPKQVWTELKFNKTFQTNFQQQNFFDYLEDNKSEWGTWDLVIGNPPFNGLTIKEDEQGKRFGVFSGKNIKAKAWSSRKITFNEDILSKLDTQVYPDNQIALMFLDQVPHLLKENGLVCLILPSAPLLYNNSSEFRKQFFTNHQVFQILDFTNLDSILFGKANVPTAALFAYKQTHDAEKPILHAIIRRTKTVEQKILFEVDKYDLHYVSQHDAIHNKHVWKCNLLGGGRLHNLIQRLSRNRTIEQFASPDEQNWKVGEGYIRSSNPKDDPADFITDNPYLPAKMLTENGFDKDALDIERSLFFERPRVEELFTPPLVLIKENIGNNIKKIPIGFSDEYLTFRSTIIGISASQAKDPSMLFDFYEDFKKYNDIWRFYLSATSNQYLVTRGTLLLKQDIMNLPYPEDKEELRLSFAEQIICEDVLKYYSQIKAESGKAKFNQPTCRDELEIFGDIFTKALNSIYGQADKCFYLNKIYDWGEYFITEFNYGADDNNVKFEKVEEPPENIDSLIKTELRGNFHLIRVVRLNEKNKFSFIKPKALRYWLRSIALRDADEAFSDLIKTGH